ncbi:MAG: helicase-related protein, partial [Candidatus Cloacimonetes bacterium]|nr:helicase-related protein [Candidatus Cloacimonadota bacterium]
LLGVKKRGKKIMGLLDLDPPPLFDLVIVDEAHHIRNENTANHKIVKFFCDNAEAVVFLTATPIQMGNRDLFVLLNTLRPDLIINEKNFEHLSAPNKFINSAAKLVRQANTNWQNEAAESLREAADTAWGHSMLTTNPTWVRLIKDLDGSDLKQERRVQMISEVEDLHTFNGIINRTRRRDIDVITTRSPETLSIPFTLEQEFIHTELLSIQKTILSSIHGSTSINFMMSTIRRQAASCILGLVPFLRDILSRHLSDLDWDEMDQTAPNEQMINEIKDQVNAMIELCSSLSNEDPKLAALKRIISDKQTLENNKIMVFSSFRHTLSYLYRHLIKDGFRIGLIHGGTKDEDRKELKRRFELSREEQDCIDVMLFSEVGCEGLDYQFCDAMVNYDLPWNPMRIEQRIGRIDRRKQKSPKVFIYNMITPGTIDADIYDRCLIRIGIFNSSLGDSEAILGDIASKIRIIGENLELTPEERKDKLQQLADNEIRTIQEQEKLEQQQYELFGIDVPKKQAEKDIHSASSFWLSPKMLEHMISCYLKNRIGRDQVYFLGDKESKTLRLAQEARAKLLADYQSLKLPNTMTGREWELYLKGGNQYIGVTFNISYAMDNSKVVLLNPIHPMVKQAASFLKQSSDTYALLDVTDALLTAGSYNFVIYQWQLHGLKNDLKLQTVCSSETIGNSLTRLLELATNAAEGSFGEVSPDHWDYLDKEHYKLWNLAKADHRAKVSDLVAYRKESLKTTHKARMEFINDKISSMIEEKILRMYYSWLANAEADFARRMQELDIAVEKADITANVVMYGIIRIKENRHGN